MYTSFVGIDIAKYKHQAAFIDAAGNKVSPDLSFDNTCEGFGLLSLVLRDSDKEQTVVGLEATGHYWLALYSFLADDPIFKVHYEQLIARGKHPKQALGAVAAKLLRVVHAVMVKQVPYTPEILANSV